jgi:ankyrin repeat protein
LVEDQKSDIHVRGDLALRWAAENGHLEVVKYLHKNGGDIHANNDEAVRTATKNGHTEILEYLESAIAKETV